MTKFCYHILLMKKGKDTIRKQRDKERESHVNLKTAAFSKNKIIIGLEVTIIIQVNTEELHKAYANLRCKTPGEIPVSSYNGSSY